MFEQHKKIYQHAGKCDEQQNLKDILDSDMVSTPEVVIDNIPTIPMTSTPFKKPIAIISLCLFTNILDVRPKTAKDCIVAAKSKRRSIKVDNSLWTKKKNEKGIQTSNLICIHV